MYYGGGGLRGGGGGLSDKEAKLFLSVLTAIMISPVVMVDGMLITGIVSDSTAIKKDKTRISQIDTQIAQGTPDSNKDLLAERGKILKTLDKDVKHRKEGISFLEILGTPQVVGGGVLWAVCVATRKKDNEKDRGV